MILKTLKKIKETLVVIFIGVVFSYMIKDSSGFFIVDIFFILYYFSLFCIFYIFIKNNLRNFFISLPIIIIIIYISLIGLFGYDLWIPEFEITYLILMLVPIFTLLSYTFKEKNIRKFFISLATLIVIVYINLFGFFDYEWWWYTLEMIHFYFIFISSFALLVYIFKDKYLWWLIFSPMIPLVIMYIFTEFYPCLKPIDLGAL